MRLRSKLLTANTAIVIVATGVMWVAYASVMRVASAYRETVADSLPTIAALQSLRGAATSIVPDADELVMLMVLGPADRGVPDEEDAQQRNHASALTDAAARYLGLLRNLDEAGIEDLSKEITNATDLARDGQELILAARAFPALAAATRDATRLIEARRRIEAMEQALVERITQALAKEEGELAQFSQRTEAALEEAHRLVLVAGVVVLLLLSIKSYLLSLIIVRPVQAVTRAARRLAAGETVELEASRSRDELGDLVTAFRTMAADLATSRREAEEASQAKERFLAAISHEIRTPLTAILGMSDLLSAEGLAARPRRHADAIRTAGRHLLSLVNDVLDFSRINAGKLELEAIDFVLADLLEEVRSLMAPQAAERAVGFVMTSAVPTTLVVKGDPTRLRQVLLNLVSNGLKFTHQGAVTLHVASSADGYRVRLRFEVRDTGIGIAKDRQEQLFGAFTQADASISRTYGGSGLGLAICKHLVEAMGGTIGVESAPGQGSTFWFEVSLPLGEASVVRQRAPTEATNGPRLRVLVVDDVATNRELLEAMLERQGHTVLLAEDGAAAFGMVAREPLDVVLMDVQMPVMDGVEATRRIRRLPPPAGTVPILALTASVMASERERYLAAGMDGCLNKPVVWPALLGALAAIGARAGPAALGRPDGEAPAALAAPGIETESLLDRQRLDRLARELPDKVLRRLLAKGLEEAAGSCGRLEAAQEGDTESLAREAHRLRGTVATLGLTRIASLATRIEDRARRGEDVAGLVLELRPAVGATRQAVEELLAAGQTTP